MGVVRGMDRGRMLWEGRGVLGGMESVGRCGWWEREKRKVRERK